MGEGGKILSYLLSVILALASSIVWASEQTRWEINSGDTTVSTDWSVDLWVDIAGGDNYTAILRNDYAGTVNIGGNFSIGRKGNGAHGEYVQNAGTVKVNGSFIVGYESALSAKAILNAGAINVIGTGDGGGDSGGVRMPRSSDCNPSLLINGGTFTLASGKDFYFRKGDVTVNSGEMILGSNLEIGEYGDATLTMNGGTLTIENRAKLFDSNYAKTINLNGGTLVSYYIEKLGGSGATSVNFNGGTLKVKKPYETVIDSSVTVNVKKYGGTIDVNGMTATIPASFTEDASSIGGGMRFVGGGTLTLNGSIGYTGGTTISAGTTIKVDTAAKKDALLGSGLNTLKVIPATAGTYTLITITGDGVFSDTDVLKASLTAGDGTFSLSSNKKSLVVDVSYGGVINQSSPTLVFPGATLADLATHTLRARFQGDGFDDDGVEATFFNRDETEDNGVLTKVTYQLQAIDNSTVKAVKVEFTADEADESGVYAKLTDNAGDYYPYDFRLVAPANAISVNFTHDNGNLNTSSTVRYGAGDFAVPYSSWANKPVDNNTATIGSATVTITGTRGSWSAGNLSSSEDLRHGYIDENDENPTPTVTVTGIPYEFYRVVAYASTDNADIAFGYITINDKNYTGMADATVKGTANWGSAGGASNAKGLREGVNYLVSDVVSGSSATIVGHRVKPGDTATARGCIAAIQIVEFVPTTYTATISDGGSKSLSALSWDNALPALLTANDKIVVNVNADTTLDFNVPADLLRVVEINVASGKTLTLAGADIPSLYVDANGAGQIVAATVTQLSGKVRGNCTLLFPGEPAGVDLTDWTGKRWTYDTTAHEAVLETWDTSLRSLSAAPEPIGLSGITSWFVPVAETREEFGKGSTTVTDVPAGVSVRVIRPNGTTVDVVPVGGTAMLSDSPQICGEATVFDATYTNTTDYAYMAPGWNPATGKDNEPTYNNEENDETTGMYIRANPWVSNIQQQLNALTDFTLVVVGTMSRSHNTQFIHMGNSEQSNNGILITTTENDDEVLIAKNTGETVDVANGVKASVPNAATARHAYVIKKTGSIFEVWVDGVKRGHFNAGEGFVLGASDNCGIQIGSDHGGKIRDAGIYKAANAEGETGIVNLVRLFDYSISDAQAEAVFSAYPYVLEGGLYTRTVTENGSLSQDGAWIKNGSEEMFNIPMGETIGGVTYNPSATLTVNKAAEIAVNADVSIETFTVSGDGSIKFTADGDRKLTVVSAALINSPVTIEYGAVYLAGAPVQFDSSGAICFDCSRMDESKISTVSRFQLTGLTDRDDEKFSLIPPTDSECSYELVYNTTGSCYDLLVWKRRVSVNANNMVKTSPTLTKWNNIIEGAGGLNIETLSIPDNATIEYDPIKTPINVWGATKGNFSLGSNVKFKLTNNYANMNLGRIVLLTYKDGSVALPENLNDLFDSATIASETYTVKIENAPENGYKQLVLTVGDYEKEAKEIRLTCIGDSITQGVNYKIDDIEYSEVAQYRTMIAARLAANGYKPKMLGIWKFGDKDAANVSQPADWIWHSGISGDRIMSGDKSGGVRDNLHVYLDVAGNVDAITLLIGTNDLGAGDTAENVYIAYTNLVFDIARQRPKTKIIGSTILDRNGASEQEKVRAFNALLNADYIAKRLPENYVMLDLFTEVPLSTGVEGNFFDDRLHPSWAGCSGIAERFAAGVMNSLPFDSYSRPIETEATDAPQSALGVAGIAATTEGAGLAAYTNGMIHVFTIDAKGSKNILSGSSPYTWANETVSLNKPVTKAGYFMELVRKGTKHHRYVWVDFDAEGKTLDEIDFPWRREMMDFPVDNLHVFSNDGSIHNVSADDNSVKGVIEGTSSNYLGEDREGNVPDITENNFGWNDTLYSDVDGYGCFQVHRIFNEGDHWNHGETLFAWNAWGAATDTSEYDELGIGTFFYSDALGDENSGSGESADYTFTSRAGSGADETLTAAGYQVVHFEIWATFVGEKRHGVWIGAGMDNDFDNELNWEDGKVPSPGEDVDFSGVPNATTINVTGASKDQTFGTATMGINVVTFTGNVGFADITDTSKIAVGENSTVTLNGNLEFSGNAESETHNYVVYSVKEGGKFVVTGEIVATEDFTGSNLIYPCKDGLGGSIQALGLVNNAAFNNDPYAFRLLPDSSGEVKWIIGEKGISGSKYFWVEDKNAKKRVAEIQPLNSDFIISTEIPVVQIDAHDKMFTFSTTGADGKSHIIELRHTLSLGGPMNITGSGRFVVDVENSFSGNVYVSDTATLVVKPGMRMTSGRVSVAAGATLQMNESGVTVPAGGLSLADGAILGFNFTDRKSAPVLDVYGMNVTFGNNKKIKVLLSGKRPVYAADGKHFLTSGKGFSGVTVDKADNCADWVKDVGVDDGNIHVNIKSGFLIIVK